MDVEAPRLNFPENGKNFILDRFMPRVGGFRWDNIELICLLTHGRLGKVKASLSSPSSEIFRKNDLFEHFLKVKHP